MSGFILKTIACIAMLVDHVGVVFAAELPEGVYWAMRGIGRLAFPIFCFFIAEGFVRTKSRGRYALRLALFALLSEIPFDLAVSGWVMDLSNQNVYLTLLLGLLSLWGYEVLGKRGFGFLVPIGCACAAQLLGADYGAGGVLLIFVMYAFARHAGWQGFAVALVLLGLAGQFHPIQMLGLVGWLLCMFYNGQRGPRMKYAMYAFYPLHLLELWLLGVWI